MQLKNPPERYTILRELGRGAISTAHAVTDRSTGATAVLKTLDPALFAAGDAKLAAVFLENARTAARLRHANIVQVHDAGEAGGSAYVSMELVEGKSLRQLLDERPLPIARAIRIFDDIASALAYAHEEGMVHRGVRPSNILVLPSGSAKIGDFGIGQIGEAALPYMSPEQVRGDPVDHRTDLFSLGAVFYEMLTHRKPFEGKSAQEIRASIQRAKPLAPSEVNPNVPGALDRMVLGLLAARPDDRVANARLLLRDLQHLEEGLGLRPDAIAVPAAPPAAKAPPAAPRIEIKSEPTLNTPRFAEQLKAEEARGPTLRAHPSRTEEFRDHHRPIPLMPDFDAHDPRLMRHREPERRSPSSALAVIALLVAVASIGLTVFSNQVPALSELRALVTRSDEAPAKAAMLPPQAAPQPQPPAPLPVAETIKPPLAEKPPAGAPAPWPSQVASAEPAPAPAREQSVTPIPAPPQAIPAEPKLLKPAPPVAVPPVATAAPEPMLPPVKRAATVSQPQPEGTAKLTIAVAPQGEIYIDGEHAGTTPPITTLELKPGLHRIEIRNGSRRPYLTYMTVEPGDERRIRHDFNAKGRPPA